MSSLNNHTFNAWVTGHKGFIGNQLLKELKNEFEIFKISRNDVVEVNKIIINKIFLKNIKKNYLKKIKNNYLFHLATLYNPNPKNELEKKEVIESNINFGLRLINFFDLNFFKKIILSQSYMELQNNNFNNLYVDSKIKFAREVQKKRKDQLVVVYIYDTFGKKNKRKKLLSI